MQPDLENGGIKKRRGFKSFLQNLISLIYCRIFHEEMSADMDAFLKNLLVVGISGVIAALFSASFTILGGRILGPGEYGKFVLVQSVSMFLYIPMLLGFNTGMLKYICEKDDFEHRARIISNTYLLVLLFTAISIIFYIIFASPLSNLFGIPQDLFYLAIVMAGLFVFNAVTTSTLRGLNRMLAFSVFQMLYAVIIFIIFILFYLYRITDYKAMTYPTLISYAFVIIIILSVFIRQYITLKFDYTIVKMLSKYAVFSLIGGLSFVFYTNVDKIMISHYINISELGIYNAYCSASITVAGLFGGVFTLVFFPTASKYASKAPIFNKINKVMPLLIIGGIPFIIVCEFIILKLFGSQYPSNVLWMVLAAIASICMVIESIYAWLLNSVGLSGARLTSIGGVLMAFANIGLNIILIPSMGITGALISILFSFNMGTMIFLTFGNKYLTV